LTHRDAPTTGRLRIGRWLPSTQSGGPPTPMDYEPMIHIDPTSVDAAFASYPAAPSWAGGGLLQPQPRGGRRLAGPWSVVVPIVVIVLLVLVSIANLPSRGRGTQVLPPASPAASAPEAGPSDTPANEAPGSPAGSPASPSAAASARASASPTRSKAPAPPPAPPPPPGALVVGIGGRCVEAASNGRVQLAICNGRAANQRWTVPGDGSVRTLGRCLDTLSSGTSNRTPLVVSGCDGTSSQQWDIGSDGSWSNGRSGKCMDVFEGFTDPGTPLIIFSCHGSQNQRFAFA
jgi:hypothetical protein